VPKVRNRESSLTSRGPKLLISIALAAMVVISSPHVCVAAAAPDSASECPNYKIMHGLLPFLIWTGILPRPTMATTIAPSDTSTSVVIRPNPNDQITCGKTQITSINDVVFAQPTLPNGKSIDLSMDIQIPEPSRKRPLVIYVTGGGFVQAPKEAARNLRTYVAEAGFVVASIEYRTVRNGANYRDGIADVKSAIRYLRANATKYNIDKDHVAVWGESAGGYLAAMVGVTNGDKSFEVGKDLDQSSDVRAVVDKFGPSDISKITSDFDSHAKDAFNAPDNPIAKYIAIAPGTHLLDTKVAATAANPLTYITSSMPAFLIFHGSRDTLVSPSQTLALHNALVAAGGNSTRYMLDGAGHGDLAFLGDEKSGLPWSSKEAMDILVHFLERSLGSR
jgi:acetyl esterase/lipase